ncbi:hypothetical protein G5B47_18670 [Paenibacillus sp. 7124]|uniref:Toxin ETX/toxin MTX2 n=1 Tax=Paenibacillus apii TaxID=1850370 RepID=A0A6M1PPF6_9BACL|nr:hypothetical protein [Paenibacillus apii]NGM84438.1 hypothetical protein [Paenibacillus apii]NJJ38388.1 hypothetical protein [Paenibacillus apii]
MKKVYAATLCTSALSLVLFFPQQTNAQDVNVGTNDIKSNKLTETLEADQKEYYFDEETGEIITDLFTITDSGIKKLSFEDFKKHRKESQEAATQKAKLDEALLLNSALVNSSDNNQKSSSIASTPVLTEYYYTEGSAAQIYMASYPVTNPLTCAAGATSCSASISFSKTEGQSFSANATTEAIKSAIKLGASFTWNSSATITTTYTLTVPGGKSGEIRFMPLFNKTTGTLRGYVNGQLVGSETTSGYSPVKLATGMLAGDIYTRVW